jgi:glutamyl-tRNA synthetase
VQRPIDQPPPRRDLATRIAPSLTGSLHLGHARTFLLTSALARHEGWRVLLRLEDLDLGRLREDLAEETLSVLSWLGVDWDGPVQVQSRTPGRFREAMEQLAARGWVFSSPLTRREIREAASAPHAPGGSGAELRFDASLRPPAGDRWRFVDPAASYRFRTDPGIVEFNDELAGPQRFDPSLDCGDFAVWTREGVPAYQLAVVVDDALAGVSEVVRGDDLLASTSRQILLQQALGLPKPRWWHLPLVGDAAGHRLAKRDGSLSIAALRERGIPAAAIRGLVAWWCRWIPEPAPVDGAFLRAMATAGNLRALVLRERDAESRPRLDAEALRFLESSA